MDTFIAILMFVNLFCAAVSVGGQVHASLGILPLFRGLETRPSLRLHQLILDHRHEWHHPPAHMLTAASAMVILIADREDPTFATFMAIGFLLTLSGIAVSLTRNVPINVRVRGENPEAPSPAYPALRRRWDVSHYTRTILGAAALVCFILAALAA
jgi:hypothetical protein